MNTSDRYLLHTIHANTLSGGRSRKGAGWGGTIFVLAFVGVVIACLLWADANLVAVHQ